MLLEREADLAAIAALLSSAGAGRGTVLFLRGEPGVGKTRLLNHAATIATDSFAVVRAGGHEMERGYPYALAQQVLEGVLNRYGADLEELSVVPDSLRLLLHRSLGAAKPLSGGGLDTKAELTYAFSWLLGSVAERRPLLLCLDDLHWGDPDSLELFRFFLHRFESLPVAVLGAIRPWPETASQLAEGRDTRDLQPLSRESCLALLQANLTGDPGASAEDAFVLTGGNPFLLEELAGFLRAKSGAGSLPSSGRSLILTRLRGLPPDSLRILEAGSILGASFSKAQATALADISPARMEDGLVPLRELGLLSSGTPGSLAFRHPLVQHAVYECLPEENRRAWHRWAADVLRSGGAPALTVAPHLGLGATQGDLNACLLLWQAAAESAAAGAYEAAALHLERALELEPPGPVQARFLYDLGLVCLGAASPARAAAAFARASALSGLKPQTRYRIHRSWAYSLLVAGDLPAARRQVDLTVAQAREIHPSLAAEIGIGVAVMQLMGNSIPDCLESGDNALNLAVQSGDPRLRAKALAAWSHPAFDLGLPGAISAAREAMQSAPLGADDEIESLWGWTPQLNFGILASQTGRYEEGTVILQSLVERGEAIHSLYEVFWASTFLAYLEHRRGRLREAYRRSAAIAASYVATLPWASALGHVVHARILAEMGDLEGAETSLARVEAATPAGGMDLVNMVCRWTRAMVAMRRGQYAQSARLFLEAEANPDAASRYSLGRFCWMADAPEACIRAGQLEPARRLLADLQDAAKSWEHQGLDAVVRRGLALLEEAAGNPAAAEESFAHALALHREVDEPLERGRTLLAYGSHLRRHGRMKEARNILEEAILIFQSCGSPLWEAQGQTERRLAGGRRRQEAGERLGRLTPQEYRIAELLSQGRSNREIAYALFISPKTLETHLRNIYRKLEVSSRRDLRAHFSEEA